MILLELYHLKSVLLAIAYLLCILSPLQAAVMNFINVVVHSAEDMNFRVHLQHEFSLLGLDDFLEVCGNDGVGGHMFICTCTVYMI